MAVADTHTRTLGRAVELSGGGAPLAKALGTSADVLCKWLSGELPAPARMYFAALDIVTKRNAERRPK